MPLGHDEGHRNPDVPAALSAKGTRKDGSAAFLAQLPPPLAVQPLVRFCRHVAAHPRQHRGDVRRRCATVVALVGVQEALAHHRVEHRHQRPRTRLRRGRRRACRRGRAGARSASRTSRRACRSRRAGRRIRRRGRTSAPCAHAGIDTSSRVRPLCATSQSTSCCGMTPTTSPPCSSTASATMPISRRCRRRRPGRGFPRRGACPAPSPARR